MFVLKAAEMLSWLLTSGCFKGWTAEFLTVLMGFVPMIWNFGAECAPLLSCLSLSAISPAVPTVR